jgi:hypothetical protein
MVGLARCSLPAVNTQADDGQELSHLDSRARRPDPPQILQTSPAAGRKPRRALLQVKIAAQLGRACNADPELVMTYPKTVKKALVDDSSNRRVGGIDKRLEEWIDQGGDRLTFSRRHNGDERSLYLMRLDQDEHAAGPQVLPGSLEGMNHARHCDSSKRPAEDCDLERVAHAAKPLCGADPECNIGDPF